MAITINGTTGVSGVDGSASTPSYQGTDTNTGLFYPAADTVAIGTDGSERLRIRSDGNVSIGGTGASSTSLYLQKDLSVATSYGVLQSGQFQSSVTNGYSFNSSANVATGATLTALSHFRATEGTISGTITSQVGFDAVSDIISATNNYGFRAQSTAAVGAGKTTYGFYAASNTATGGGTSYGFYAAGTANNYFAGKVGVGNAASTPGYDLDVKTSGTTTLNVESTGAITGSKLTMAAGGVSSAIDLFGAGSFAAGVLQISSTGPGISIFSDDGSGTSTVQLATAGGDIVFTTFLNTITMTTGDFLFGTGVSYPAPTTITTATYTVATSDAFLIANRAGTVTLTLLAAASYPGRVLTVKNIQAQTVVSASANVKPIGSNTAGTAILAATAGKFATLVSDGTNWIIMQAN